MIARLTRRLAAAFVLGAALAGCREDLTAPGSCPATCPGGTPVVRDTFLDAVYDGDHTYTGYYRLGNTESGLRVANGLNGATEYGIVRFEDRTDSVSVRDTLRTYTIDSVALTLTVIVRDTLVSGTVLQLHRLPATVDSTATFAAIDAEMTGATLLDSLTLPDSIKVLHSYRFVLSGSELAALAIAPGDSGVLAIGLAITGGTPTGIRAGGNGSANLGARPVFQTYVTVDLPPTDTVLAVKKQLITRGSNFTHFVSSVAPVIDDSILTAGSTLRARSLIRFPWPSYLKDSVKLVRATLELVPEAPMTGLRGDSGYIWVRGVRVDFGPKSPIAPLSDIDALEPLILGSADTVRVQIINELHFWQGERPHPPLLVVSMVPEGASFNQPRFFSTRSPSGHPRLRVTYQVPFDFGSP